MPQAISSRVQREQEAYERGIDRGSYENLLASHAGYMYGVNRGRIAKEVLTERPVERVLEIGRYIWYHWLELNGIFPAETVCINIAEKELEKGREQSRGTRLKPRFMLMDAHELQFPDGYFDAVCGCGILHHLDLDRALREIRRVLNPEGVMLFSEPLDNNPVGWLVRKLTPEARTEDETPFRPVHLATLQRHFDCKFHYEQMASVPFGLASRFLFKQPENVLTRAAFRFDEALQKVIPAAGPYYRKLTIIGRPPRTAH
jgi:SAM-dependent methyltransferase